MGCEHASTTVLLHLFGEAPEGYSEHLARCEECQEALAEHAVTVGAVEGVFLRGKVGGSPAALPLQRRRWLRWMVAAAAAVALAWGMTLMSDEGGEAVPVAAADAEADAWVDPIERELDLITEEFDSLSRELEDL